MTGLSVASVDGNQIQKGQTLNSGELSQFTNHWHVTAGDGDVVLRVFPGMSLGETETGELSLDGGDALLSLSIGSNELLVVFVLKGGVLESEEGEFCERRHLAFDSSGVIKLPNNILRFDKDILSEAATDASLLPRAVWRMAGAENRTLETGSLKKRQRAIVATASAVLVCVLIGLVYAGMRTAVTPGRTAQVAGQIAVVEASGQAAVQPVVEEAATIAQPGRDQILSKSKSARAPIATPATAAPEKTVVIAIPPKQPTADDITSTPAVAAAKPLSQNRPTPEVAERAAPRNTAAAPKNTRSRRISQNPVSSREVAVAAPVRTVAEAESRRVQEQAQTALVMYERDLLAAELALVQGRLTQPPENSAYILYKDLVASNPESSEARRGFKAVGAALVNRAFAELAAKRWSDARATLAAAAEAGASANLVADLNGEVAYQQQLAEAEDGRFAALYPAAQLVALNRTTPRLRRYAPDGIDMVQIEFTITVAGNVQDIEVLGAPPQRLERVVRQAVADWRFEPVLSGTRQIPVRTRVILKIP